MYSSIIIENEIKKHISIILKYYRSSKKVKQSDFIRFRDVSVCSADTYSRIENGKIIKRSSIYTYLLYQINATYEYFPSFWKRLEPKFKLLAHHLNQFNMYEYRRICEQVLSMLKDSTDFLAREIFEVLSMSISIYDEESPMDPSSFKKLTAIKSIFPPYLCDIVNDLLLQFAYKQTHNIQLYCEQFNHFDIAYVHIGFLRMHICRYYFYVGRYLESHELALCLEQQFLKEKNFQALLDVYEIMLLLYHMTQSDRYSEHYVQKLLHLIQEHHEEFHCSKYHQGQFIYGLIQFKKCSYQNAYDAFVNVEKESCIYGIRAALYIAIMSEHHPLENSNTYITHEEVPMDMKAFYEYHIYKMQKHTFDELETYLIKRVAPYMNKMDCIFWEPFEMELRKLIKETKHYYLKKKL